MVYDQLLHCRKLTQPYLVDSWQQFDTNRINSVKKNSQNFDMKPNNKYFFYS